MTSTSNALLSRVVNVIFAGAGAAAASEVLARAAFRAGHDVKQAEVRADLASVRFGAEVLSPVVPHGEADYLVALDAVDVEAARPLLRASAVVIGPEAPGGREALLRILATHLDLPEEAWEAALAASGPERAAPSGRG